jgi:hypothetical protein
MLNKAYQFIVQAAEMVFAVITRQEKNSQYFFTYVGKRII